MKIGFSIVCMCLVSAMSTFGDQAIADVQRALKEQGFYYGEITGQKDADTTAAIRRFQIRNGLQITGELNAETLQSIKSTANNTSQTAPPAAHNEATAAPTVPATSDLRAAPMPPGRAINPLPAQPPGAGSNPDGTNPDVGRPGPSRLSMFDGTPYETAPIGVQRRVIADAQRILARRGLFKGEIDGTYGPNLEFSVRAYQSRVGLPTTGQLDLETLAALQLLPGAHAPALAPRRSLPPVRGEWVRP
jgi:peptidoglycan hydrolase-like protein with peptidoglycan-binding domain